MPLHIGRPSYFGLDEDVSILERSRCSCWPLYGAFAVGSRSSKRSRCSCHLVGWEVSQPWSGPRCYCGARTYSFLDLKATELLSSVTVAEGAVVDVWGVSVSKRPRCFRPRRSLATAMVATFRSPSDRDAFVRAIVREPTSSDACIFLCERVDDLIIPEPAPPLCRPRLLLRNRSFVGRERLA